MFDTEQFKKAVLNKAFRGELTSRLPEDGSAEDLLKEIDDEKKRLIEEGKIKKQKALPNIGSDEIPFEIPSNWKWVRLGDITHLNSGHNLNKIVTENGSINYAKVADMNSEGNEIEIVTTKNTINDSKYTLPKGSIIFPKIGGAIKTNKRRIINNEFTAIDPNIMSITPVVNCLFDFLYIYMKKIDISKISFGTSMPSISKTNVNNLIFPLPPLAEQQRIVSSIEKCFKFAEYIEKENELTKDFQVEMKKSLLQAAMKGDLTNQLSEDGTADDLLKEIDDEKKRLIEEGKIKKQKALPDIEDDEIPFDIPSNWKWVRLGDITYLNSGHNLNKIVTENGSINYAKVADMNSEGNEIEIVTTKNKINDSKYTLPKGSIIFPKIGGAIKTNKRRIINNELTAIDPNIMSITPVVNCLFDFLYIYMKKIDLSKISFGTSMPSISKTNMNNLIFPLPPLAEQQRIVEKLDALFSKLDD